MVFGVSVRRVCFSGDNAALDQRVTGYCLIIPLLRRRDPDRIRSADDEEHGCRVDAGVGEQKRRHGVAGGRAERDDGGDAGDHEREDKARHDERVRFEGLVDAEFADLDDDESDDGADRIEQQGRGGDGSDERPARFGGSGGHGGDVGRVVPRGKNAAHGGDGDPEDEVADERGRFHDRPPLRIRGQIHT